MFSIITCSNDDARFARAEAHIHQSFAGTEYEIIRIADARSMCGGYNRGIAQSRGEVLIFTHDDVELLAKDIPAKIERRLQDFDLLGVAGTTELTGPRWSTCGPPFAIGQVANPDPSGRGYVIMIWNAPARVVGKIQAIDGLWMCAKRSTVEKIGFDEKTFTAFHLYDIDFSYRAFQAGLKIGVCNDFYPLHASFGGGFDGPDWQRDAQLFLQKSQLAPMHRPPVKFNYATLSVLRLDEAIERMTPPWWIPDEI